MSLKQQASSGSEVDERLAALMTNANAVRAIAAAVEGTLGPKGLDTMLVDKFGDVVITNDGVTILTMMEANHPAARMVVNVARAQQEEVGDGTTTATVLAGALVGEAVSQVVRGVPVTRVIEGIKKGIALALQELERLSRPVAGLDDPVLARVALIAGREHEDIAALVMEAARLTGREKLKERGFKLADTVMAKEGAENQVFQGVIITKEPMNTLMPTSLEDVKVLVVDDALEPEELEEEALGTEAGFKRYLELRQEFREWIHKIVDLGVGLVLVDRGVDDEAEEILTDAGVMVIQRVANRELEKAREHTGARSIKRTGLKKSPAELENYLGRAARVEVDKKLELVRIFNGAGKPAATVLVGAATDEVVGERERIARDAASSLQAAVRGGYVPGGGAVELALSRYLSRQKSQVRGMAVYGFECVIEALKRPFMQIVTNAGFNPLEKIGDVLAAQEEKDSCSLAVDCETGEIADMLELGVVDPTPVKYHAIKAAGEIAVAILRIDTIIRMKEEEKKKNSREEEWLER